MERGDADGNLHFHVVIRLRCNVSDKAELLTHCKNKCGMAGSGAGTTKWSIQHLESKKGEVEEENRRRAGGENSGGWGGEQSEPQCSVLTSGRHCRAPSLPSPFADWIQTPRCISKQCKSAHFKDENFGCISSTMPAGDWEQLCAEWVHGGARGWWTTRTLLVVDHDHELTLNQLFVGCMSTAWAWGTQGSL